jgi:IclR family acetate operon transcriptional repressor
MLAYFSEERVKEFAEATGLPPVTPQTISSYRKLRRELAKIRAQGYGVDNQESGNSLWGIAAPVFDHKGTVVGALGLAGTTLIPDGRAKRLIQQIKKSALAASRSLGYATIGYPPASGE